MLWQKYGLYSNFVPNSQMFLIDVFWHFTSAMVFEPHDVSSDQWRHQQHGDDYCNYQWRYWSLGRLEVLHASFTTLYTYTRRHTANHRSLCLKHNLIIVCYWSCIKFKWISYNQLTCWRHIRGFSSYLFHLVRMSVSLRHTNQDSTFLAPVGSAKPVQDWPGPLQGLLEEMGSGRCNRGAVQTMSHIVESCPATKLEGGLRCLHAADKLAIDWIQSCGSWSIIGKQQVGYTYTDADVHHHQHQIQMMMMMMMMT